MLRRILFLLIAITSISVAQIVLPPESHNYVLFWGNQRVGYYTYVLEPVTGGWEFSGESFMAVSASGRPGKLRMLTSWKLDSAMRPKRYELTVFSNGEPRQHLILEISDASVSLDMDGISRSMAIEPGSYVAEANILDGWILLIRHFDIKETDATEFSVFVPQMGRSSETKLIPGQFEMTAGEMSRKFNVNMEGVDIEFFAKVDSRMITYWNVPSQNISARWTPRLNREEIEASATGVDILETGMSQSNIIADLDIEFPLELRELEVIVDIRFAVGTEAYFDSEYQESDGEIEAGHFRGRIKIDAKGYDGKNALSYPVGPIEPPDETSLLSTKQIQSDEAEIIAIAETLAADCKDIWCVAKSINRFVADSVQLSAETRFSLSTLNLKSGDALSHARLCVALSRAAGIPARVVGGVILDSGFWLRHHWVEIWMGKKPGWIPIDPTTGEDTSFSAAHLTLWFDEGHILPSEANKIEIKSHEITE